ncbi:MAG: hypothetical protein JWN03_6136 [Nocardia sp.]|uniref:Rv0361 family membrane protein n=1 Tax=Nocardia sp. TaxID=1821 RepID=UPI002618C13A|nr:hypothetical protein [Nocardia sp.]MCU1645861.1 hypothetical protein [Nocardia sp.]
MNNHGTALGIAHKARFTRSHPKAANPLPQSTTDRSNNMSFHRASLKATLVSALALTTFATLGCGSAGASAEGDVRTAIQAFFDSINTGKKENIIGNSCSSLAASFSKAFDEEGTGDDSGKRPFSMTVDSISNIRVYEDTATADIVMHSSSKPDPRSFVATIARENGAWKYCTL